MPTAASGGRTRREPYCLPEQSGWSLEYDELTPEGHAGMGISWPPSRRHCRFDGTVLRLGYTTGETMIVRILDEDPVHETALQSRRIESEEDFPASQAEARRRFVLERERVQEWRAGEGR
jgi:hypothetical protein